MELTQFVQYFLVNDCDWLNRVLTYLGHILVWTQPILWNNVSYKNTSERTKRLCVPNISLQPPFQEITRFFPLSVLGCCGAGVSACDGVFPCVSSRCLLS